MSTSAFDRRSGYQPTELLEVAPIFVWPPQPLRFVKWLCGFPGYLLPWNALYALIAILTWQYLTPSLDRLKTLSVDWVSFLFLRNVLLLVLWVSVFHIRLYTRQAQGTDYKYNARWPSTENSSFVFHSQLWDNVFWSVCSAAPIWTLYEVVTLWMQANKFVPCISFGAHPVFFTALMLAIPLLAEAHFYLIHRLIHWRPLYRAIHSMHHKNVNPGPWSGLAMHPIEHLLYFSGVMLHWIVPSHPIHVLFHLRYTALGPASSHCGFDKLVVKNHVSLRIDQYMHYLHHKHFEVNYGSELVPFDKWFGTFHDGSKTAHAAMKRRIMNRNRNRAPKPDQ